MSPKPCSRGQSRSYERLTLQDLRRLGKIAAADRESLLARTETGRFYTNRLIAVALCQGAALHFIDGKTGIKDLDVWSFYRANPACPFPYRRRGTADFGDPKFGKSDDRLGFIGRRVDLMGRSLAAQSFGDPVAVLRDYLHAGRTLSARLLAKKAVIMIEPRRLLGTVVWPPPLQRSIGKGLRAPHHPR